MGLRSLPVLFLGLSLTGCGENSGSTIQVAAEKQSDIDGSGIYQAYNSTVAANTNSLNTVPFDLQQMTDESAYEQASDSQVTILVEGLYRISYEISYSANYSNRVNLKNWVAINTSEVPASQSYCYTRNNSARYCSNAATSIFELSENDMVEVGMSASTDGTFGDAVDVEVIANESWLLIEYVGPLP